ncbi:primosomal protein DnaI [Shimazuella sp. AN120528]|uniref:primosomal protein DnaI n=1 Tax=Shimazuella soli TaxID=1892854 RepID=UPI001F0DEBE0|nr:primosomal protein DnaI [Shimazuella soli]MCH5585653.1 primosomal protein DnaI [Shimazuella soli]
MKALKQVSPFSSSGAEKAKRAVFQRLQQNKQLQSFMQAHPDIPLSTYWRSIPNVKQYVTEKTACENCRGLEGCTNIITGHFPKLIEYNGFFDLQMQPCRFQRAEEEAKRRRSLIRCEQIPSDIQKATFETFVLEAKRAKAFQAALHFCVAFRDDKATRGLYLYGDFGVGKSYLAGAIMNELAVYGVSTLMIHTSALFSEMKNAISQNGEGITEKLEVVKTAPLLILDDIGAESLTPWIRDDILGVILQYRMTERLPIIFTSNLTLEELEDYFSNTPKGGEELIKGKRIMERIKHFVQPIFVDGVNRRSENHI